MDKISVCQALLWTISLDTAENPPWQCQVGSYSASAAAAYAPFLARKPLQHRNFPRHVSFHAVLVALFDFSVRKMSSAFRLSWRKNNHALMYLRLNSAMTMYDVCSIRITRHMWTSRQFAQRCLSFIRYWSNYFDACDALVFVIDSSDRRRCRALHCLFP